MPDNDNPIITCTEKELCWDAWQRSVASRHSVFMPNVIGGVLGAKSKLVVGIVAATCDDYLDMSDEKPAFEAWWERVIQIRGKFGSRRSLVSAAWNTAVDPDAEAARRDRYFAAYFQRLIDSQPVVSTPST